MVLGKHKISKRKRLIIVCMLFCLEFSYCGEINMSYKKLTLLMFPTLFEVFGFLDKEYSFVTV